MKKLIAFMLIAALIFCCVGCTPETPEVTDPSGTQPTETDPTETDPTGTDQTDGTEDPMDSDEPEEIQYTWKQVDAYLDDQMSCVSTYHSLEELLNSEYRGMSYVEDYDEAFFENNTLIIANFQAPPPVGFVVTDFVRNEDGTYSLAIERLTYGVWSEVAYVTTVVIEVYALLPADAEIVVDATRVIVPEEEIPHKDVHSPF